MSDERKFAGRLNEWDISPRVFFRAVRELRYTNSSMAELLGISVASYVETRGRTYERGVKDGKKAPHDGLELVIQRAHRIKQIEQILYKPWGPHGRQFDEA